MPKKPPSLSRSLPSLAPRLAEINRPSARARGYSSAWDKASERYRHEHPRCVKCLAEGRVTSSEVTDHIIPYRGDQSLFWDESNWQALCKRCHDAKTAAEDGGFGNDGR